MSKLTAWSGDEHEFWGAILKASQGVDLESDYAVLCEVLAIAKSFVCPACKTGIGRHWCTGGRMPGGMYITEGWVDPSFWRPQIDE